MFCCVSGFILAVLLGCSLFFSHLARSLTNSRCPINVCRGKEEGEKNVYVYLVSQIKLSAPQGQRRHARLLLHLVPSALLGQVVWDSDREHLMLMMTTMERRGRERGEEGRKKKRGRKTNRKENLEQRTKPRYSFLSQMISNCSLVLAKGKTEGMRGGKFRKQKSMNQGCNCEQHFKFTKSFVNLINIKFSPKVTSQ